MVALVTGASRGIGKAIAIELAALGYDLALVARNESALAEVIASLPDSCGKAVAIPADLSQEESYASVIAEAVSELGGLDVLVNCAGLSQAGSFTEVTPQEWDRIFAVVKSPTPSMFAVCAELQTEAKLYDDAERTYRILGTFLESPDLVNTKLGQLEFNKGNYKKALELLQKAPLDTERLLIETDCYMRLRNYDKALERIRNAARITPALLEGRRFRLISANIADKANNMQYVEQMLAPLLTSRPPAPPSEDVPEAEIYNSLGYIFADHDYKLPEALQYPVNQHFFASARHSRIASREFAFVLDLRLWYVERRGTRHLCKSTIYTLSAQYAWDIYRFQITTVPLKWTNRSLK